MDASLKTCSVVKAGTMEYGAALALQLSVAAAKKNGFAPDVLVLLEHPPTITLGRSGKWHNLLVADEVLRRRGVARYETDRGGDITFHGPGQLVGYPILRLEGRERDVHGYMRKLEETLIRALARFGVEAWRREKLTGVWTAQGKIAAMGVHISRWVTRHGFALNVATDLSYFDLIRPCGLVGQGVASMASILGRPPDMEEVAEAVAHEFGLVFGRAMAPVALERLLEATAAFATGARGRELEEARRR